jgi:hypothetical protein
MMRKTTITVTDDIDGTPGAETHRLTVDGYTVDIDLAEPNRKELYEQLRPYLDAGRRITGKRKPAPARRGRATPGIRDWWKKNPEGLPTWQARGAIPAAVARAWQAQR